MIFLFRFFNCYSNPNCGITLGVVLFIEVLTLPDSIDIGIKGYPVTYQVGIIGRTGAGKSSILNVLFRLYPICGGSIMVDGVNIAGVSVRYLRSSFAVVPQAPFLFEGSLR